MRGNERKQVMMAKTKGFSLISTLVAAAMLGFLALTLTQLLNNGLKGTATVRAHGNFATLHSNLELVLRDQETCKEALKDRQGRPARFKPNTTINPNRRLSQVVLGNAPLVESGQIIEGSKIDTLELRLRQQLLSSNPAEKNYLVEFVIGVEKPNAAFGGRKILGAPILLRLTTKANNGDIISCDRGSSSGAAKELCESLGGLHEWARDPQTGADGCQLKMQEAEVVLGKDKCQDIFPDLRQSGCFPDGGTANKVCQEKGYKMASTWSHGKHNKGFCSKFSGDGWKTWNCGKGGDQHFLTKVICIR